VSLKDILYDWGGLNVWLFHAINGLQGDWWGQLMLLGTRLADHDNFIYYLAVFCCVVAISLWRQPRAKWPLYLGLLVVFVAGFYLDELLITGLKLWFDYPRPLLALPADSVHVLAEPKLHHSLPSGHSAFAALLIGSVWPLFGLKGRIAALICLIWVGLSRIVLGAHFPADVLAGCLISFAVCAGLWWLWFRLMQRKSRIFG